MTTTDDEYLTDRQLADLLHTTTRTNGRRRVAGDGPPFVRAGARRVLYRRVDVLDWLAARTYPHRAAEAVKR